MSNDYAIKYSCGPAASSTHGLPSFNDVLDDRPNRAIERPALGLAIELIRFMGAGDVPAPNLCIDDDRDLAPGSTDRLAVSLLLETVGAGLFIGEEPVIPEDCTERLRWKNADDMIDALLKFAAVQGPAKGTAQECGMLRNLLGLTGAEAARVLNVMYDTTRFNAKQVLFHAGKRERAEFQLIQLAESIFPDFQGFWPSDVASLDDDPSNLHWNLFRATEIVGLAPSLEMITALTEYRGLTGRKVRIPAEWPKPKLRESQRTGIKETLELVTHIAQNLAEKPDFRSRARNLASKMRKSGSHLGEIAAELNRQGYPVSRGGKWHRQSVATLLDTPTRKDGS